MNMYERATEDQFDEITEVWEASVRATHHFLKEEDIVYFKPLVRNDFLGMVDLYSWRENGRIRGFMGVLDGKIEMLFIHPEGRGQGIGKAFAEFAIRELGVHSVDVNEQNDQAVGFYRKMGFNVVGRSEVDALGKPYPILQMKL